MAPYTLAKTKRCCENDKPNHKQRDSQSSPPVQKFGKAHDSRLPNLMASYGTPTGPARHFAQVRWNDGLRSVLIEDSPRLLFFFITFDLWVFAAQLRHSAFGDFGVRTNCLRASEGETRFCF